MVRNKRVRNVGHEKKGGRRTWSAAHPCKNRKGRPPGFVARHPKSGKAKKYSLAGEGDEENLFVAFDLEGDGLAGFYVGEGFAQAVEGGDGQAVEGVDDVAGL